MLVYIAGPLFSEYEAKQRLYEGEKLETLLSKNKVDHKVINPITLNDEDDPELDSIKIFKNDFIYIEKADAIFYDLSNEDSGTVCCMGVVMSEYIKGRKVKIYPVFSDSRLKRNQKGGLESTKGLNSFVVGILKANDIAIFDSSEKAFEKFKSDFKLS